MKTPASKPEPGFSSMAAMAENSILGDEEREELIASLKEAEADVAAGRVTSFDKKSFKARFMAI
ncbi:hypothetical protein V3H18_03995 [Methylocystis sp. 9N]|uniref:Addiction module antitoxin RelB n=1 Tax=Methylocystis borbori TaxID=3118750 RepID=A0ABU7XEA0_9HYPH